MGGNVYTINSSSSRNIHLAEGFKYKTIKNPIKADAESNAAGRELWKKNCSSCYGDIGLGDSVKSRTLKVFPGNFSANAYQSLYDAEILSIIKFGEKLSLAVQKAQNGCEFFLN